MPQPEEVKLFFVCASDDNGENADVLVRAADKEEAKAEWRKFYAETFGEDAKDSDIMYIGEVPEPLSGKRGYIPWGDINPD